MTRLPLLLALALACTPTLAAQQPTRPAAPRAGQAAQPADSSRHTILYGFVLDSMTNLPLAGATVVIPGTVLSAATDEGGRFRFVLDTLPPGTYQVGFFHPTLDSLGITPPTRRVAIMRDSSTFVELAVPSTRTLIGSVCPDSVLTAGGGLLMGTVHDAVSDAPISGARVVATWTGLNVSTSAVLKVPRAASVLSGTDGGFRLCGLPPGTRIAVQARAGSRQSGWIEFQLSQDGFAMRSILLGTRDTALLAARNRAAADSLAKGEPPPPPVPLGNSLLTGTVTAEDGKPLENAQILLLGSRLSTRTNAQGAFRFPGLPAGTQSVEIRQIGYSPRRFAVNLTPRRTATLAAVLPERAQVLQAVEVAAKAGSNIAGFDERRKRGFGSFMTRDDIEKRGAINTTDLLRGIAGVEVVWDGSEYVVQMTRSAGQSYCPVQYYVDGAPLLASTSDMDGLIRPDDIEAIEVYRSGTATPVQFQSAGGGSCGTIVIWTRRSTRPPKQ